MGRVQDKVCIVTGAASGIGRATALLLASEGAKVVLTDLNEDGGTKTAAECAAGASFVRQDVADESGWKRLVSRTEAEHGRLDVLVNNAGILIPSPIETATLDDFQKIMNVNVAGVFLGCKHALPAMARAGGGSIVNMSSIAALRGQPLYPVYAASKGAVRSLTLSVAAHCRAERNGVRCNAIHPGGMNTPMVWKLGGASDVSANQSAAAASGAGLELGEPREVANTVLYLASDDSRFVSGGAYVVDNGYSA